MFLQHRSPDLSRHHLHFGALARRFEEGDRLVRNDRLAVRSEEMSFEVTQCRGLGAPVSGELHDLPLAHFFERGSGLLDALEEIGSAPQRRRARRALQPLFIVLSANSASLR